MNLHPILSQCPLSGQIVDRGSRHYYLVVGPCPRGRLYSSMMTYLLQASSTDGHAWRMRDVLRRPWHILVGPKQRGAGGRVREGQEPRVGEPVGFCDANF